MTVLKLSYSPCSWSFIGFHRCYGTVLPFLYLKKSDTSNPASLRPISISSNLTRQFHKLICNKLIKKLNLSPTQYGFQKIDGVAKGIDKLQAILREVQDKLKPIFLAVLDIQKAFDAISHEAIFNVTDKINISNSLKSYLKFIYAFSKTSLMFKGDSSDTFHPVKGVRLGEPLSPWLFPLVFNLILDLFPIQ